MGDCPFEKGLGYFFITNYDGIAVLNADKPEWEGQNLDKLQDYDIEKLKPLDLKGFLKKPFTDEKLLEILQAVLKEV